MDKDINKMSQLEVDEVCKKCNKYKLKKEDPYFCAYGMCPIFKDMLGDDNG
jgi:hypothetical protein